MYFWQIWALLHQRQHCQHLEVEVEGEVEVLVPLRLPRLPRLLRLPALVAGVVALQLPREEAVSLVLAAVVAVAVAAVVEDMVDDYDPTQ